MTTDEALRLLELRAGYDAPSLKNAYRAKLLHCHPDKHHQAAFSATATVQDVKVAYELLSTLLEKEYRRPADTVVDLDEFTYHDDGIWTLDCRCGHEYRLTEKDMDQGKDVVGCDGCSLHIRVLYEEMIDEEEDDMY